MADTAAILTAGFLLLLLLLPALVAAQSPQRVLLIHSFGRDFAPFDEVTGHFRTELAKQSPRPIEFIEASLEMARFDGADRDSPLLEFLAAVFGDRAPDLIVPIGAPAAMFCGRHRGELYPQTALIALGLDRRRFESLGLGHEAAMAGTDLDLGAMLDNILQIRPQTRHIYVVLGTSPLERFWEAELRRDWSALRRPVAFHWLNDRSLEQILQLARTLPPDAALFVAILNRDGGGIPRVQESGLEALRSVASVPIFGYSEQQLGRGIVGGRLMAQRQLGRAGAEIAARLLAGHPALEAERRFLPLASPVYDARELVRWSIPESALPAGSAVCFRQPGLWEAHRVAVLLTLAVIAVQSLLIARLIEARRRERGLNRSIAVQRDALAHLARVSALNALSGSLAHELNQPLGIILSNAQAGQALLERNPPDLGEIRCILEDIVKADRRAGDVIQRLRAFLRRREARRMPLDLNEIVTEVLALAQSDLVARQVTVETRLAKGLALVACDRVQLQQVMLNLLINSCDAVQSSPSSERTVRVVTTPAQDRVRVSVHDRGAGLPADTSELFEPFFTTKAEGMGFGLAISRSIIEAHGGRIWAESLSPGAAFHFELPAAATVSAP